MKLAVMQPYFFPYLGYFQLINSVDKFVIYDNVEYTKRGWINRNKLLFNNEVAYFTINLKKDSDYLDVTDRIISPVYFNREMPKILRKIKQNYKKAPYFKNVYPLLQKIFRYKDENLLNYILNSIIEISNYLDIKTKLIVSSKIPVNNKLKNKLRVFEIYNYFQANTYINSIGGNNIYLKEDFEKHGVNLRFLKSKTPHYKQNRNEFIPNLSIIDVMMFNSLEKITEMLGDYILI